MLATGILLHGFGQRYDLPISLALYLYGAAGVVIISFVLVVLFSADQVGTKAGWDRLIFVILMLSSVAFDGIIATSSWVDFRIGLKPIWIQVGAMTSLWILAQPTTRTA